MISYQFFILHPIARFETSLEEEFKVMFQEDNTWIDNNLTDVFPYLIMEENDETGSLNRKIILKSSSSAEGYPEISEGADVMKEMVRHIRSGAFSAYPEIKEPGELQLTLVMLETEDPGDRKKLILILEKLLLQLQGIVIHPEVMRLAEFRSFFSLQRDVVEAEKEPEEEDN